MAKATDGVQALEALDRQSFDVVLMDCQMPNMDGYEAVQRWRRIESRQAVARRVPVIALTANAMAGDRERCLEAGYDDHVGKPFSHDDMQKMLARWLPRQSACAQALAPGGTQRAVSATPIGWRNTASARRRMASPPRSRSPPGRRPAARNRPATGYT